MQLRQAKALGVLDQQQRRVRHVDAHLHHRRADQQIDLAARGSGPSRRPSPSSSCRPCSRPTRKSRNAPAAAPRTCARPTARRQRFGLLHQRADDVAPAGPLASPSRSLPYSHSRSAVSHPARAHRLPAGRQLADQRDVQVAEDRQRDRARNGRRRHHQVVRIGPQLANAGALMHAELVLLVDDHQPQPGELHALLHQRLRADHQVDLARLQRRPARRAVRALRVSPSAAAGAPGCAAR